MREGGVLFASLIRTVVLKESGADTKIGPMIGRMTSFAHKLMTGVQGLLMLKRATASLALIICGSVSARTPSVPVEKSCREHPQIIGKCFTVHGRLSVYNGNPAVRLRRSGTKRILGVSDQRFSLPEYRNIPESLMKELGGENEIVADFLVCPFTRQKPGEMQLICIESAKNVAVRSRH